MQTAIWAGEDAWDAFDEAVGAVLKKPIREEQARGVYFRCLLRVRSRRFRRQKGVARLSREFLENLPAKPHIAGNFTVGEQTLNDVEKAIATLSPREQRVIRLRYFHGRKPLPYETIGRQEGVRGECGIYPFTTRYRRRHEHHRPGLHMKHRR
jgi:DNA-directed RNA polymerase specialized sigma24 family protein